MGRRSKLTEKQWESIGVRLLDGEPARALAREFGVSDGAIRKRFSTQHEQIKEVAKQLVVAETAFKALPISAQISTRNLADKLRSISENLAGAAEFGAMTAYRLSGIAKDQAVKVDSENPMFDKDLLAGIATLTRMANASGELGVNLLRANKEIVDDANKGDPQENRRKLREISDDELFAIATGGSTGTADTA